MRGFPLIFLLLVPAFIALGHDIYLFYTNHMQSHAPLSLAMIEENFKFSALGFIWTSYDVESYKMTVGSVSKEDWAFIDWILTFKAFFVGLGFAAVFLVPMTLFALIGKGPLARGGGVVHGSDKNKKTNPLRGRDEAKTYKYKRK